MFCHCLVVLSLLVAAGNASISAGAAVPAADLEKIRSAASFEAPAKPKKPRNVLIFSRADGYIHEAIPWGAAALQMLGEKTGAYLATLSDDPAIFDRERLSRFDAVVFNNNCGNPVADLKQRANLLESVRGGKGLVGIHCAAHLAWPEYTAVLGGYSISHPWNAGSTVTVRLEEPDHPLVRGFGAASFSHTDEIFVFRDFSRERARVLLRLDTAQTDMNKPGVTDKAGDYPLSWIRREGQGRVFYSALGHQKDVYWRPAILKHYLARDLVRKGRLGKIIGAGVVSCNHDQLASQFLLPAEPMNASMLDWNLWLGPAPWRPFNSFAMKGVIAWHSHIDIGRGWVNGGAVHPNDAVRSILGCDNESPVAIYPADGKEYTSITTWKYADGTFIQVGFDRLPVPQEVLARFSGDFYSGPIAIIGTEGKIVLSSQKPFVWTDPPELANGLTDFEPPHDVSIYREWHRCIRTRERTLCNEDAAYQTEFLCHSCEIAQRLKRPLRWDAVKEEFIDDAEANRLMDKPYRAPWHL